MKTLITNLFMSSVKLNYFLYLLYIANTIVVLSTVLFLEEYHFTYDCVMSVFSFVKNFKWV